MRPQMMDLDAVLTADLDEAELHQPLADAHAASRAAAEKASTAKQNLKRADDLLSDAEGRVFRLEGEFKKAEQLVTACVADAIRAGNPLPKLGAPEVEAELSAAKAKAASIRAAYGVLDTEYRAAAAEATKAAAAAEKLSLGAPNRLEAAGTALLWTLGWALGAFLLFLALALSLATL